MLEAGEMVPATRYIQALRVRQLIKDAWRRLFDQVDAVIAPAVLTGSFFLAMAAVTVAHGAGVISVGSQGWLWIGAAIAVGTVVLWIVPERLFGRFLTDDRSG